MLGHLPEIKTATTDRNSPFLNYRLLRVLEGSAGPEHSIRGFPLFNLALSSPTVPSVFFYSVWGPGPWWDGLDQVVLMLGRWGAVGMLGGCCPPNTWPPGGDPGWIPMRCGDLVSLFSASWLGVGVGGALPSMGQ